MEETRGSGPRGPGGRPLYGPDDRRSDRGGFGGRPGLGGPRRRGYRVTVSGLPDTGSWQDLKDHMRTAGDVIYADVTRDGNGIVEFAHAEDAKYAVRKLDDTKFTSHEVSVAGRDVKVLMFACHAVNDELCHANHERAAVL